MYILDYLVRRASKVPGVRSPDGTRSGHALSRRAQSDSEQEAMGPCAPLPKPTAAQQLEPEVT